MQIIYSVDLSFVYFIEGNVCDQDVELGSGDFIGGDKLQDCPQQLYIVQPDHLQQGTICSVTWRHSETVDNFYACRQEMPFMFVVSLDCIPMGAGSVCISIDWNVLSKWVRSKCNYADLQGFCLNDSPPESIPSTVLVTLYRPDVVTCSFLIERH